MFMKYKVLLCGRGKTVIDDFFTYVWEDYELQTTSVRVSDMSCHLKYFKPDAMIFCMNNEEEERVIRVAEMREYLQEQNTALILVGDGNECMKFQKKSDNLAELILKKPIHVRNISKQMNEFLEKRNEGRAAENTEEVSNVEAAAVTKAAQGGQSTGAASSPVQKSPVQAKSVQGTAPAPETASPAPAGGNAGAAAANSAAALRAAIAAKAAAAANAAKQEGETEAGSAKKHVLVVDDDPMMLKLIKEHLKDIYNVATAINGSLALKFLETKKTDFILMDYEMPGENGAEVLGRIRKNPATANIPVVFLTGISTREAIQQVMAQKPQGYMLKPIDRDTLLQTIAKKIGN